MVKEQVLDVLVHEVGLFPGRLGMGRAIVLVEDGCQTFFGSCQAGCAGYPLPIPSRALRMLEISAMEISILIALAMSFG